MKHIIKIANNFLLDRKSENITQICMLKKRRDYYGILKNLNTASIFEEMVKLGLGMDLNKEDRGEQRCCKL